MTIREISMIQHQIRVFFLAQMSIIYLVHNLQNLAHIRTLKTTPAWARPMGPGLGIFGQEHFSEPVS